MQILDFPPVPPAPDPRLLRPWRVALVAYWLALTAGTHWPNLAFGEEMPATDKTTHLLAFAGLTVLLFRTGWFASAWRAAVVAAAWSVIDELTQGIPGLNRMVGAPDIVANVLGCTLAGAWLAAMGPVGGPPSRWRQAMLRSTLDRVFLRPAPWFLAVALALVTAGSYQAMRRFDPPLPSVGGIERLTIERGLVLATAVIALHVGVLAVMRWWQRSIDRARSHGLCVSCGRDLDAKAIATPDATDATDITGGPSPLDPRSCSACGRTSWAVAWLQSSPIRAGAMARAAILPALVVGGLFVLGTAGVFLVPYGLRVAVGTSFQPAADAVRRALAAVPATLETPFDITISGVGLAIATGWTRRRMSVAFDRPVVCRACGHDLRGTPMVRGVGRCTECGEVFLHVDDPAEAPPSADTASASAETGSDEPG